MPMILCRKVAMLAAAAVPMFAIAADQPFDIRPGEWKYTLTMKVGDGSHTTTDASCLTAEDIRAMRVLQMGAGKARSCAAEVTRQSARLVEGELECRAGARITRIRVRLEASSPTKFSGTMRAVGTDGAADLEVAAEWVDRDCRAVEEGEGEVWDEE